MGSIDKTHTLYSFGHGFDDVGFAQPTGTISSVSKYNAGKWAKYALVESAATHGLAKGQPVNISGTTDYDGPTRVVEVKGPTAFVIKRAFSVTKSGNWDVRSGLGNWDGLMAIGADVTAANIAIELFNPDLQGGNELATNLTKDKVYPIPGGIKKCTITNAGNIRLIRAASTKPMAVKSTSVPTVVAYSPPTAAIGATLDILGSNFDPIPDRNSVQFLTSPTAGVYAKVTNATEEILTVVIPDGVAATGVISVKANGGQNASGPVFTRG